MLGRIRYLFGALVTMPLLPLLAYQGKKIKASVPTLPEAEEPEGFSDVGGKENRTVIYIGESTIAGVGVDFHKNGFPGSVSDRLAKLTGKNIRWKVYARSGYTAKRVRFKLVKRISETDIDLIVIGLGGNDAFTLNRPWTWNQHIRELIDEIRSKYPTTPIAFPNMPPIKEFPAFTPLIKFSIGNLVELFGKELTKLSKTYDRVYYNPEIIKLEHWIPQLGNKHTRKDFFSDGVHPSQLTYFEWGKNFAEFLVEQNVLQN